MLSTRRGLARSRSASVIRPRRVPAPVGAASATGAYSPVATPDRGRPLRRASAPARVVRMPPENSEPGSTPDGSRRRLDSFVVDGLFGVFRHSLELKTEDHITISHGPNGVGKTTVLRLIEALFKPRSRIWRTTEFSSVVAKFLPSGTLEVKPLIPSGHSENLTPIPVHATTTSQLHYDGSSVVGVRESPGIFAGKLRGPRPC